MSAFDDIKRTANQQGTPVTFVLVAAFVACFLLAFMKLLPVEAMVFQTGHAMQSPWTLFTYPFADMDPSNFIGALFTCLWLYWIGGTLERDLGPGKYLAFFFGSTLLGSLAILLAAVLLGGAPLFAFGALFPLSALTVAWGTRYPTSSIMLWFVIPITGKWVAWLTAGIVLFGAGAASGAGINPMVGIFACIPLVAAWAFAAGRLPFFTYGKEAPARKAWKPSEKDDRFFDEVRKREKDREERERLRKLFESSLIDDPDDDRGADSGR